MKKATHGFTLIELIVSISILSVIMVSVFMIFALSADLNNKTDISRSLQENIKNIVEVLSEDIRKNGIVGVNSDIIASECDLGEGVGYMSGTKLCTSQNTYYIAKEIAGTWNRVTNYLECQNDVLCVLVKNSGDAITPISNTWVNFQNLQFYASGEGMKKVVIHFEIRPSSKKGIKKELIQENALIFQTTLSERLYSDY